MSYLAAVQQCAPEIQDLLENYFLGVGSGVGLDQRPFLQFVNNQVNTLGLRQKVSPTSGKEYQVDLLYRQPFLESDITGVGLTNCDTGTDAGNMVESYFINPDSDSVYKNVSFTLSDLRCISEPFETFFVKELARLIDGVDLKVSDKTADQLALLAGKWSRDTEGAFTVTSNALNVDYKDSSSRYFPEAFYDIASAATMTQFGSNVVMFGGQQLHGLARHAQAGCCTTNGVDVGNIWAEYGFASIYDRHVAESLGGQNYSVLVQPGSVALLTYNEAGWNNGVSILDNSANYTMFSVMSPKTGTPMDVLITDVCKTITISVSAATKLVGLPTDLYQTSDNLYQVKWVNKIKAI